VLLDRVDDRRMVAPAEKPAYMRRRFVEFAIGAETELKPGGNQKVIPPLSTQFIDGDFVLRGDFGRQVDHAERQDRTVVYRQMRGYFPHIVLTGNDRSATGLYFFRRDRLRFTARRFRPWIWLYPRIWKHVGENNAGHRARRKGGLRIRRIIAVILQQTRQEPMREIYLIAPRHHVDFAVVIGGRDAALFADAGNLA
jgi:hypothetical protein